MATPIDAAATVATSDASSSSSSSVPVVLDAAADPTGILSYPQWDAASMGLPADFILYSYNRLKG